MIFSILQVSRDRKRLLTPLSEI